MIYFSETVYLQKLVGSNNPHVLKLKTEIKDRFKTCFHNITCPPQETKPVNSIKYISIRRPWKRLTLFLKSQNICWFLLKLNYGRINVQIICGIKGNFTQMLYKKSGVREKGKENWKLNLSAQTGNYDNTLYLYNMKILMSRYQLYMCLSTHIFLSITFQLNLIAGFTLDIPVFQACYIFSMRENDIFCV